MNFLSFFVLFLSIFQGDLSQQEKRAVFLTVHDLGCNRMYFNSRIFMFVILLYNFRCAL